MIKTQMDITRSPKSPIYLHLQRPRMAIFPASKMAKAKSNPLKPSSQPRTNRPRPFPRTRSTVPPSPRERDGARDARAPTRSSRGGVGPRARARGHVRGAQHAHEHAEPRQTPPSLVPSKPRHPHASRVSRPESMTGKGAGLVERRRAGFALGLGRRGRERCGGGAGRGRGGGRGSRRTGTKTPASEPTNNHTAIKNKPQSRPHNSN